MLVFFGEREREKNSLSFSFSPVRLQQHRGPEVLVLVPPVGGARRRAASAKDALVEPVELGPVLLRLEVLLARGRGRGVEVRADRLVLGVEVAHVDHEVLDDEL